VLAQLDSLKTKKTQNKKTKQNRSDSPYRCDDVCSCPALPRSTNQAVQPQHQHFTAFCKTLELAAPTFHSAVHAPDPKVHGLQLRKAARCFAACSALKGRASQRRPSHAGGGRPECPVFLHQAITGAVCIHCNLQLCHSCLIPAANTSRSC